MHIETERKFLIKLPETEMLASLPGCEVRHITQTYLMINSKTGEEKRVRRIEERGRVSFVVTEKERITAVSRTEHEYEIGEDEYRVLRDTKGATELTKTRYAFPYEGHTVEIDVYPHEIGGDALDGLAVLEVELVSEDEEFSLPPFITVLKELTGTKEFSNKTLAKPRDSYGNNVENK